MLRRTRFLLREAEDKAERLEALLIALANLDDFIRIIRDSRDRDHAKERLMALSWTRAAVEQIGILIRDEARVADGHYRFSERQVSAILDLRLYQLTGLERESIKGEYDALIAAIKDLLDILRERKARPENHQGRAARDSEEVRQPAPHPDRRRGGRDLHGGPHRQ